MASTEPTQTEPVSSSSESRTEVDEPIQIHQVSATVVTGTESYRDPWGLPRAINPWRFCARRDARCTDSAEPSASTPYYPDGGESMAVDTPALLEGGGSRLPATQSPSVSDHQPVVSDSESEGDVNADIEPAQGRSPISAAKTAAQEALDGFWHDDRLLSADCRWSSLPPRDTDSGYERRSELTMTVRGRGFEQPEAWAFTEAYLEANLYLDYAVSGVHTEPAEEWRSPATRERDVSRPDRFENTVTLAPFTSQYQPAHPEIRFDRIKPGEQLEGAVRVDLSRAQLNRRLEQARSYLDARAGPSELPPQPFELEFELFDSDRCERVQTALATMVQADEPLFLRFALADEGTAVEDEDFSLDDDSQVASAGDRVLSILFLFGTSSITHRFEYLASIPEDLREQVCVLTWLQGLDRSQTEQFVRDAEAALVSDVPEIVTE